MLGDTIQITEHWMNGRDVSRLGLFSLISLLYKRHMIPILMPSFTVKVTVRKYWALFQCRDGIFCNTLLIGYIAAEELHFAHFNLILYQCGTSVFYHITL